jgi:hypothetical protein
VVHEEAIAAAEPPARAKRVRKPSTGTRKRAVRKTAAAAKK